MVFEREKGLTVFDGAIGTEVQKRAPDASDNLTELLNLKRPEIIKNIHLDYLRAGAHFLTTNTFSANGIRLARSNHSEKLGEINEKGVLLAKQAIEEYSEPGEELFVAGSIGPTGETLVPLGDSYFEDFYETFHDQAEALRGAGADWLIIETMESLREAKAALIAALEVGLPIISSLSYGERGRTSYGVEPEAGGVTLERLGCNVLAMNCGTGPGPYPELIRKYSEFTEKPLLAEANAGTPELKEEEVIYEMTPEEYVERIEPGLPYLSGVGSCCGSDPNFTELLAEIAPQSGDQGERPGEQRRYISNNASVVNLDDGVDFTEIEVTGNGLDDISNELGRKQVNMLRFENIASSGEKLEKSLSRSFLRLRTGKPAGIVTGDPEQLRTFLKSYPGIAPVEATGNKTRIRKVAEKYGGLLI